MKTWKSGVCGGCVFRRVDFSGNFNLCVINGKAVSAAAFCCCFDLMELL